MTRRALLVALASALAGTLAAALLLAAIIISADPLPMRDACHREAEACPVAP